MSLPDRDRALAHRLVEQENALLLDVRTPEEFAGGHPDGAVNIPHDQVASRLAELGDDKDRPVVIYCMMGGRAGKAKDVLVANGFSKVTNVGGLSDYQ